MHFRVFVFTSQYVCFGGKRKLWWFLSKFSNAYLNGSTKFNCFKIVANETRAFNNLNVTKHYLKSFGCEEIFCFQIHISVLVLYLQIGQNVQGIRKGFLNNIVVLQKKVKLVVILNNVLQIRFQFLFIVVFGNMLGEIY